jgi:hypothetical protein
MLRSSLVHRKKPVILKFGEGLLTQQLKHLLEKKPLHHHEWDELPQYPPRKLRHADRALDPRTGAALVDPARDQSTLRRDGTTPSTLAAAARSNDDDDADGSGFVASTRNYIVPDQHYGRVPVPQRYRDAYWWRERQARRVQCPMSWVADKYRDAATRQRYSFMDFSFEEKFRFSVDDVIAHAKEERR